MSRTSMLTSGHDMPQYFIIGTQEVRKKEEGVLIRSGAADF